MEGNETLQAEIDTRFEGLGKLVACRTEIVRPELDVPDISGFLRIMAQRPLCPVARYKTQID